MSKNKPSEIQTCKNIITYALPQSIVAQLNIHRPMDWTLLAQAILSWWPWLSFWGDLWFLQLGILYILLLMLLSTNIYYILIYLFFQIFYFGVFLGIIQMDLFTGFLWVLELTIIFISVLLLFYVNYTGTTLRKNKKNYYYYYSGFFFLLLFNYEYPGEFEGYIPVELVIGDLWEDYYEANNNTNMNDFMGLLVGYYTINSFEFILIGIILLIGSVACVNLFKATQLNKAVQYDAFFKLFTLLVDFIDYIFMRKQNLTKQTASVSSSKVFRKK
jgi:hypothetical protein